MDDMHAVIVYCPGGSMFCNLWESQLAAPLHLADKLHVNQNQFLVVFCGNQSEATEHRVWGLSAVKSPVLEVMILGTDDGGLAQLWCTDLKGCCLGLVPGLA